MATEHRYHRGGLVGDGLRAVTGLALCAWPPAVTSVGPAWASILAALALLFALYGLRGIDLFLVTKALHYIRGTCVLEYSNSNPQLDLASIHHTAQTIS